MVLHGHIDVVPAQAGQFEPRVEGDRLYGRGTYDMKGALAAMLLTTAAMRDQDRVRVRMGIVGDEESEEEAERGSDHLVDSGSRRLRDHRRADRPPHRGRGQGGAGVAAAGSGIAAHGATPWLGDNAVLRAIDVFRSIESLPFARHSSELFDRPSINLGRILGGDALNKVPDQCAIDVDIATCPTRIPPRCWTGRRRSRRRVEPLFTRPPAVVDRDLPYVRALSEATWRTTTASR